jgi:hypothetical protein
MRCGAGDKAKVKHSKTRRQPRATSDDTQLRIGLYNFRADPAEMTDGADKGSEMAGKLAKVRAEQHSNSAEFPFPVMGRP